MSQNFSYTFDNNTWKKWFGKDDEDTKTNEDTENEDDEEFTDLEEREEQRNKKKTKGG